MIKLFETKKSITDNDYQFLKSVILALPEKYIFLINQVSRDFILDKKINELGDKGTFRLVLNAKLEQKYIQKSLPNLFIIRDIKVWNSIDKRYDITELHILQGMLAGYRLESSYNNLDLDNINIDSIKEKHFDNSTKERLLEITKDLSQLISDLLDLDSTFIIEIENKEYYVIKDYKDGNYLATDNHGKIYSMVHDPYSIQLLFENLESFSSAVESNLFNIEDCSNIVT